MRSPDGRKEGIDVQQMLHGNSARARLSDSISNGRSVTATVYFPRFSKRTLAGGGSAGFMGVRIMRPPGPFSWAKTCRGFTPGSRIRRCSSTFKVFMRVIYRATALKQV